MGGIEEYEELGVVGKGNFGAVYLVRRRSNDERFVLKQLLSDGAFMEAGTAPPSLLPPSTSLLLHPHPRPR